MSEKRKATLFDVIRFSENALCSDCIMNNYCEGDCLEAMSKNAERANETILKWCDEHPAPTRQSEFLKLFPDARLDDNNTLWICPVSFDKKYYKEMGGRCKDCDKCRKDYWNERIEESE